MQPRYLATVEEIGATMRVYEKRERRRPLRPEAGLPTVLSRVGIGLDMHPLEDTPYQYQVGISLRSRNPNFIEWRDRCPDLEPTDGNHSGVVLFDGEKIIGGYTARAVHTRPNWDIIVHADYRNQGLMTLAMAQWFKAAPFAALSPRPITERGKKAALSAHKLYLRYAIEHGEPVPQNVIDSMDLE